MCLPSKFIRKFLVSNLTTITDQNLTPLHKLIRKNKPFNWTIEQDQAFTLIKEKFTSEPILSIPDHSRPFILETDASNFAIGAVLSQYDENNVLHPCAFMSKGLKNAETRYDVYDKELLAIIAALKEWRNHLQGAKFPFKIYCDHRNLKFPKRSDS